MKSFYMIGLAALSLMLMTGSCRNEDLLDAGTSSVGKVLTMRAEMGSYANSQTRAQVELGKQDGAGETFQWNEGDSFTLYDQGSEQAVARQVPGTEIALHCMTKGTLLVYQVSLPYQVTQKKNPVKKLHL